MVQPRSGVVDMLPARNHRLHQWLFTFKPCGVADFYVVKHMISAGLSRILWIFQFNYYEIMLMFMPQLTNKIISTRQNKITRWNKNIPFKPIQEYSIQAEESMPDRTGNNSMAAKASEPNIYSFRQPRKQQSLISGAFAGRESSNPTKV